MSKRLKKITELEQEMIDSIAAAEVRANAFVVHLNKLCNEHRIGGYLITFAVALDETAEGTTSVLASTSRYDYEYQLLFMQDKTTAHVEDEQRRVFSGLTPLSVTPNHFLIRPLAMPELFDTLDFQTNWNKKLDCDYYTTFRLHNPARYYVGKKFDVTIKKVHHHNGQVAQVKPMYLAEACSSLWLTTIDTGYPPDQFRRIVETMYKNSIPDVNTALFALILIRRIKPEKVVTPSAQTELL